MPKNKTPSLARRDVVVGLCVVGALPAIAASSSLQKSQQEQQTSSTSPATSQGTTLATSEMDNWARIVGTRFDAAGFRLNLVGVQALPSEGVRPPEVTRDSAFLAVFEVVSGGYMPGDLIYSLRSSRQILDVFLANAFTQQFPNRMHAVFN